MTGSAFDIELDDLTLARARRGDAAACERIFRLFERPAHAIAFRVCQCPELAQDVTQDAFIKAFRRLRQYRGDAPFWGWLRRVVVNHAISALRRLPPVEPVQLQDHHASTAGDSGRIELGLDLEEALAQLAPEDRAVVWLYDVEDYSHAEIAGFFGLTESFSKTRLSRARARLRELMGDKTPADGTAARSGNAATDAGSRHASTPTLEVAGTPSGATRTSTEPEHTDDERQAGPSLSPAGG